MNIVVLIKQAPDTESVIRIAKNGVSVAAEDHHTRKTVYGKLPKQYFKIILRVSHIP